MAQQLTLFGGPVDPEEEARKARRRRNPDAEPDICGFSPDTQHFHRLDPVGEQVLENVRHGVMSTAQSEDSQEYRVHQVVEKVLVDREKVGGLQEQLRELPQLPAAMQGLFFAGDPHMDALQHQELQPFCEQLLQAVDEDAQAAREVLADTERIVSLFETGTLSFQDFEKAVQAGISEDHLNANWSTEGYEDHMIRLANGMMKQWKAIEPFWATWFPLVSRNWELLKPQTRRRASTGTRRSMVSSRQEQEAKRDFVARVLSHWNTRLLGYRHFEQLPEVVLLRIRKGMSSRVQPAEPEMDFKSMASGEKLLG